MKLGFIGAGNMGGAILKGIIAGGKIGANDIFIRNSSDNSTQNAAQKNGVQACGSLKELAQKSDIVFIGVKPYLVAKVLEEIKDELKNKIVISMAASVEIRYRSYYSRNKSSKNYAKYTCRSRSWSNRG